jgi:hypothetical protein
VRRALLLALDVALLVGAGYLGVDLYRRWSAPLPGTPAQGPAAGLAPAAPASAGPAAPRAALPAFAVVAERNLFSPNRQEQPPEPARPASRAAAAAPPAPKPRLYGIILLPDGQARAYLEDTQKKRVFAYSVGDPVADSRLEQIKNDRVVLRRGGETYEVLLRDPTKPRAPAAPPAPPVALPPGAAAPAAPGARPAPGAPGVVPGVPGAPAPATGFGQRRRPPPTGPTATYAPVSPDPQGPAGSASEEE